LSFLTRKKYLLPRLILSLTVWLLGLVLFLAWHDGRRPVLDRETQSALRPLTVLVPREYVQDVDMERSESWLLQIPDTDSYQVTEWKSARYPLYVPVKSRLVEWGLDPERSLYRIRGTRDMAKFANAHPRALALGVDLYPETLVRKLARHFVIFDLKMIVVGIWTMFMLALQRWFLVRLHHFRKG